MPAVKPAAAFALPRIRALPGVLSNQIAAGEVIERPASVVKELIENSYDAGARRIEVEVESGGVGLVRVRDDGCGIHRDDLALALGRHATSKIATLDDLERIRSYGFRGEALPSIASVSRLSLASRPAGGDSGYELVAEGAEVEPVRPASLPEGTRVSVRDLFFNTPARRKFLRTERTEFRHVEDVVRRAALGRFDAGLSLRHNGREVFRLAPAATAPARAARVARLLGGTFAEAALEVEIEGPGMILSGWLGAPGASRAHPDTQYFFINGRPVRDSTARHAVRQAFGERLAAGRHPAYLLYLDLDPTQVDVNVHPAKHEVRFRQSRLVHDFLWRALARALDAELSLVATHGAAPEQRSGDARSFGPRADAPNAASQGVSEWQAVYAPVRDPETGAPSDREAPQGGAAPAALVGGRYAARVGDRGIAIVDLAEARRALILDALRSDGADPRATPRPLLLPSSAELAPGEAERLEAKFEILAGAGFELRRSGPASIALRAVPGCLAHVPASVLLEEIRGWAKGREHTPVARLVDALARLGGGHLEDLAADPREVAALVRFAQSASRPQGPALELRLDPTAIADLMKR